MRHRHGLPSSDPGMTNCQKGQLFMMGFDGTAVTPQIRRLIQEHHLGSILLTAKNLKCEPRPVRIERSPRADASKLLKKPQSSCTSCKKRPTTRVTRCL